MRGTLWLLLYLVKASGRKLSFSSIAASGRMGFRDFLRWLVYEKLLMHTWVFVVTYLKMRVLDVPGEVKIAELPKGSVVGPREFHFADSDFSKETVFKNFKAPSVGRYKIVSFHNGPSVQFFEVLLISLVRRWRIANVHEVLSVASSVDLKKVGLKDDYYIVAIGTIIRRSSAIFSICCPVVAFNTIEKEKTKENRVSVYLHELPGNLSSGHHVLFRIN